MNKKCIIDHESQVSQSEKETTNKEVELDSQWYKIRVTSITMDLHFYKIYIQIDICINKYTCVCTG